MADSQAAAVITKDLGDHNLPKGVVLRSEGTYTVPASGGPGIGETLELIPIPEGATLLDLVIEADDGTATMTCTVGDGTTADKYGTVSDATAAFLHRLAAECCDAFAADGSIFLTFGVAAPTATHVYKGYALYTMD